MHNNDEHKHLAVILYLANKADRGIISLHTLLFLIYIADKAHLHRWGRTITHDLYCRMDNGPVPMAIYTMLTSWYGDGKWRKDLSDSFKLSGINMITAFKKPDTDELSKSDMDILDKIYEENKEMGHFKLEAIVKDKAYYSSKHFWMPDEDLAEGDVDLIEHIRNF